MRARLLLLLLLAVALVACPVRRTPSVDDDDDDASGDDDDSGAADDDDASGDDDDDATGDDDDDDATPDPTAFCMLEALAFIEAEGVLGPAYAIGDTAAQSIYSCETYQMLGVNLLAANAEFLSAGALPSWNLTAYPDISINETGDAATLSLTGCNPYTCDYYTNTFAITATTSVTMAGTLGPGNQPMIDVIFGTVSHDAQSQLQSNSIFAGCSLGNLNEDLQANGVDIFDLVVNDLNPHIGVGMQLHLYDVEVQAEADSILCMAGG